MFTCCRWDGFANILLLAWNVQCSFTNVRQQSILIEFCNKLSLISICLTSIENKMDESFPQARQFCKILFRQLSFTLIRGWTVRKVMGGGGILIDARVFFIQCKVEIFFFFTRWLEFFFCSWNFHMFNISHLYWIMTRI